MSEMFINEIITDLSSEVPEEYLKVIQARLIKHCNNYDIQPRETRIAKYTGYLPEFYKIYFVSRKIEGLSQNTLDLYNLVLNDFFFTVNKPVEKIKGNDIKLYLYNFQEARNITNRTLDSRRSIIHAFFEWQQTMII